MNCRFCGHALSHVLIDLNSTAVANAFLSEAQLDEPEIIYPLKALVCDNCFLVQTKDYHGKERIFSPDYAYFSSISDSWLAHSKRYAEKVIPLFDLDKNSYVIEIASNDGYLLQYFDRANIPCLGIEPAERAAQVARGKGIDTLIEFFDDKLAARLRREQRVADLIIGNNVLAHVPNLNSFVSGLKICLKPGGAMTFEFPHLLKLISHNEFDTIYHEHFSYFSLYAITKIFALHGLKVFDVEELATHGGSLRVYAKHAEDSTKPETERVSGLLEKELAVGVDTIRYYEGFQSRANEVKTAFLRFIVEERARGKKIAAFGAAAKGSTFLNYCGIKPDLIEYVVDDTPSKQGKFLPQNHIPIFPRSRLREGKPDIIVIIPWNFKEEIIQKLGFAKEWGAKFVTYIPELAIE